MPNVNLTSILETVRPYYEDAIWEMVKPIRFWSTEQDYEKALAEWEREGLERKRDRIYGPRLGPGRWEHYKIKHHQQWVDRMRHLVPGKKPGHTYRK